MPPVCNPQHFLPLMNYSRLWLGGRSIMQEAEAQAGPSFQLTSAAPSSRVVLSAGLCTRTSETHLSSWHQAAHIPRQGNL